MQWLPRSIHPLPEEAGNLLSVSVTEDGACHCLTAAGSPAGQGRLCYWRSDSTATRTLTMPDGLRCPVVAPFDDGRVLVANAISPWAAGQEPEKNATIFDAEDNPIRSFHAGSSIADIQIDPENRIWVSFLDEGIYGNHGWANPGPDGLGAGGLVCLDEHGQLLWAHNTPSSERFIDDCYALNVTRSGAFFFYYDAFDLGHVTADFAPAYYRTPLSGCSAVATDGAHFVFSRQYDEDPAQCSVLTLRGSRLGRKRKATLVLPEGKVAERGKTWLKARGKWMHAFHEGAWIAYHMDDLPGAAPRRYLGLGVRRL